MTCVMCNPWKRIFTLVSLAPLMVISPMASFVHKVVIQRRAFLVIRNAQNEGVLEMRTKFFGHGGLKCSFSQMEGDLDFQKIGKLVPFPKKKTTKRKVIIVTMKRKMRKVRRLEKLGKL